MIPAFPLLGTAATFKHWDHLGIRSTSVFYVPNVPDVPKAPTPTILPLSCDLLTQLHVYGYNVHVCVSLESLLLLAASL